MDDYTNSDIIDMVVELYDAQWDEMNDWEMDFIESVAGQSSYSEVQKEKIIELWRKHCD